MNTADGTKEKETCLPTTPSLVFRATTMVDSPTPKRHVAKDDPYHKFVRFEAPRRNPHSKYPIKHSPLFVTMQCVEYSSPASIPPPTKSSSIPPKHRRRAPQPRKLIPCRYQASDMSVACLAVHCYQCITHSADSALCERAVNDTKSPRLNQHNPQGPSSPSSHTEAPAFV